MATGAELGPSESWNPVRTSAEISATYKALKHRKSGNPPFVDAV